MTFPWVLNAANGSLDTNGSRECHRNWGGQRAKSKRPSRPSTVFPARSLYFPVRGSDFVVSPQNFPCSSFEGILVQVLEFLSRCEGRKTATAQFGENFPADLPVRREM